VYSQPVKRRPGIKFNPHQVIELVRLGSAPSCETRLEKEQIITAYLEVLVVFMIEMSSLCCFAVDAPPFSDLGRVVPQLLSYTHPLPCVILTHTPCASSGWRSRLPTRLPATGDVSLEVCMCAG